jgi:hypothetical protein
MSWHAYRLIYRLESPLHIGWRKIGNLMQTRLYVTGRNWWGAAASHLTQWLGIDDYQAVGKFVRDNLIFGYFFLAEDPATPFLPRWEKAGICYGTLSADQFEWRFLSSVASTAIDYQLNTAAEGLLHEVEFIVPKIKEGNIFKNVFLVGHLLARDQAQAKCANQEVSINCDAKEVYVNQLALLTQVLAQARIGGERRYGFGRIKLDPQQVIEYSDLFGHKLELTGEKPMLELNNKEPLPAHFSVDSLEAEGEIEPLLGREWDENTGPGRRVSVATICWAPGSKAKQTVRAEIRQMGVGVVV